MKSAEIRQATGQGEPGANGQTHERWARLPWARALLVVGVLALAGRVLLVLKSIGSNDMLTWQFFAAEIHRTSIGHVYDTVELFNHPPLMGLFASTTYALSLWTKVPFPWLFKAPMLLADCAAACLLYWSYKPRGPVFAAGVFALFCLNPVSLLISSYHGNTDSLCASLLLLGALLMDLKLAFWAGLALAASINVKLVPVLLILPFLACVRDRQRAVLFSAGLALGVLPFLPYLIGHWHGFYAHVLAYRSYPNVWGIGLIAAKLATTPRFTLTGQALVDLWLQWGTLVVLLWPALLAIVQRVRRVPLSARQLCACTMLGFIVVTPGWGVQYLVYPAALLFASSLNGAVWYSLAAGAYLHVTYMSIRRPGVPYFSDFSYGESATAQFLSGLAWVMAARVVVDLLRSRPAPALPPLPARLAAGRAPGAHHDRLRRLLGLAAPPAEGAEGSRV